MFPERTQKEKYEGLLVHGDGVEGLISAEPGNRAPRPGPVWAGCATRRKSLSPLHCCPGGLSEKATPPVTDRASPLPSVLGLHCSTPAYAARSRIQEPYLPRPHALGVTLTTPAKGADTAAVKQCGRKAGRMRSRTARGRARRVFRERARAQASSREMHSPSRILGWEAGRPFSCPPGCFMDSPPAQLLFLFNPHGNPS